MLQYKDGSSKCSPSYKDNDGEVLIGIEACLQLNI